MLKDNYYHFLDADYTNDTDLRMKNPRHSCNPRLNNGSNCSLAYPLPTI